MKKQVTAEKDNSKRASEFLRTVLRPFALRLLVFTFLLLFFLLCVMYIPQNITYEYSKTPKNVTANANPEIRGALAASSDRSENDEARDTSDVRILRIGTGSNVCVYLADGTMLGCISFSDALTEYDLLLLQKGVALTSDELSALIDEAEAFIPY